MFLFVLKDSNIFDFGYATLDKFFELAPWILLLLVPAISMRAFADEFRAGTFELLRTRPLTSWQVVLGKYLGCQVVVLCSLLPTLIYVYTVQHLSAEGGIDVGGTIGSYIGLSDAASRPWRATFRAPSTAPGLRPSPPAATPMPLSVRSTALLGMAR